MWFTETPWPPSIILLVAAVVVGIVWSRNRKNFVLAAAALCLVAIPVVFIVERAIVTPAEEVMLRIADLRDAVISDDVDATLDFFSQTAIKERALVVAGMALVQVRSDLRVTDVSVDVTANDTLAKSHLRANGTFVARMGGFGDRHMPTRWQVSWRKEAGEWKIYGLERLDPLTGESVGVLSAE